MKLFRRILRYMMLLLFIIVLWFAYYYRALVFSEVINNCVDNAVNRVLVFAHILPEKADPATRETQAVPDCETTEEVAQATETEVETCVCEPETAMSDDVEDADSDQATDEEPAPSETEEQTPEADPEQDTGEESALGEIEEQETEPDVGPVSDEEPAQTDEEPAQTEEEPAPTEEVSNVEIALANIPGERREKTGSEPHFELINQARLLHMTGNSNNAIELYRELGELYPDDPNVYGELGNVYYLQGDWKQASQAYYEAALRLRKLRMNDQIHYLYLVIHGLDPETAEKLREQLES